MTDWPGAAIIRHLRALVLSTLALGFLIFAIFVPLVFDDGSDDGGDYSAVRIASFVVAVVLAVAAVILMFINEDRTVGRRADGTLASPPSVPGGPRG